MGFRNASLFIALAATACSPKELNVGSNDDGAIAPDNGTDANDGGAVTTRIAISTCDGEPLDASATRGVGFASLRPSACGALPGPTHPAATVAEMKTLLLGDWLACSGSVFGIDVRTATGVELTSDGRYYALGQTLDYTLARLDSSSDAGAGSGTYDVADGSATYGPGAYELLLHPANGGLFRGQVVVSDGPRHLQLFAPNANAQVFAPPAPWSPRAAVCSCVHAEGTKVAETDPSGLTAAMTGRWLWCGSAPQPNGPLLPLPAMNLQFFGPRLGMELSGDGQWSALDEDPAGVLSPASGPLDHGTFQLIASTSLPPFASSFFIGLEPLSLELRGAVFVDGGGGVGTDIQYTQVIVTENPRALLLSTRSPPGSPGGGGMVNSILFPMP